MTRNLVCFALLAGCFIKPNKVDPGGGGDDDGGNHVFNDAHIDTLPPDPQFVPSVIVNAHYSDTQASAMNTLGHYYLAVPAGSIHEGDLLVIIGNVDNGPQWKMPDTSWQQQRNIFYGADGRRRDQRGARSLRRVDPRSLEWCVHGHVARDSEGGKFCGPASNRADVRLRWRLRREPGAPARGSGHHDGREHDGDLRGRRRLAQSNRHVCDHAAEWLHPTRFVRYATDDAHADGLDGDGQHERPVLGAHAGDRASALAGLGRAERREHALRTLRDLRA